MDLITDQYRPKDFYTTDESAFGTGENGDYSGSPYGYSEGDYTAINTEASTPVIQTAVPQNASNSNPEPLVKGNDTKKPWYDVISQIIAAGASGYGAVKAADSGLVYNQASGQYQPAVADKKFSAWLWVIIAVVAIIVLWIFIASKNKQ